MKAVLLTALFGLFSIVALAQPEADPTHSPRFLVHLLDYLAKDYSGAVSKDHKVLSKSEYAEQLEFAESAMKTESSLSETKSTPEIGAKVRQLHALIESKESPEVVTTLARDVQRQVIVVTGLEISPNRWPDLAQGKALFTQNCSLCHGANGAGDGPAGKALKPPPANFKDNSFMKDLAPFNAFNTIRLGVPGTPMPPFHQFSDEEVWALSFFISSIRYEAKANAKNTTIDSEMLKKVASLSDTALLSQLGGTDSEKQATIAALRTRSGAGDQVDYLTLAKTKLLDSGNDYRGGNQPLAKAKAIQAYIEGIEPIEARVRASDPDAVTRIEERMAEVRSSIETKKSAEQVDKNIQIALKEIESVRQLILHVDVSPWVSFVAAFAILLREGFEAVLIVLALLGVIRASGSREAALWVHGGWTSALGLGFICWFFSGWLMQMSGGSREMLEGSISLFAVAVLLYVGFWLHRQTEIGRWKNFLEVQVKSLLQGKNLFGLAAISFLAVFREAFETVLFLQAIWLDAGPDARTTMVLGIFSSLGLVIGLSWIALNYSKRLPIKQLFNFSSVMMLGLATILAGKGFHSLQEAGFISVTTTPVHLRYDLVGVYPTMETAVAQTITFLLVLAAWLYGKRPSVALV
ncbi:MAG: FTR1 family protein [Bdellovibrionales bacterium]